MTRPMQYKIYKGKNAKFGAIQFALKPFSPGSYSPAETGGKDGSPDEGCVFVDIANATAADVYDWANKMVIALSVTDLGKILFALRTGSEAKIFHDPKMGSEQQGQVSKSLNFSSPGGLEKGFMINGTFKNGDSKIQYSIPLSPDEVTVLGTLVAASIPACLGW